MSRFFWSPALSNFAALPVRLRGQTWPTAEHLYQAWKFGDDDALKETIRLAPSPRDAKRLAYDCRSLWRPDWEARKVEAMRWVLRLKARDHAAVLVPVLESSEGMMIVEPTRRDLFWGGYFKGDALMGQNWLGRLWMEIRDEAFPGPSSALRP
jgi:ribA/ribD-fused uncharacterized protein